MEAGADSGAPGQSAFEGGAHVPAKTSQRIACDASKVVMTHDADGNILDLGRKTRIISPALRRALTHRDQGYRVRCGPEGEFQFLRPDGKPILDAPPLPAASDHAIAALAESLLGAGIDLEELGGYPEWDGSGLDLAWAVEGLRSPSSPT